MSPWTLVALSLAFLLAPWVLMPWRRSDAEIRGVLRLLWSINAAFCAFWYRLDEDHFSPLPEHGPAILIANHTCPVDSMLLQATSRRVLGFLIAKEYFDFWAFRWLCGTMQCIPVRRDGHDLAATRAALRALKDGRVLPIFPEGRITPASGRVLGEPRPGVAFIVLHARVPVIPAYVWGTPETDNFWKALRTPSRARVIYGTPIDLAEIVPEAEVAEAADKAVLATVSRRLMDAIQELHAQVLAQGQVGGAPARGSGGPRTNGSDGTRRLDDRAGAVSGDLTSLPRP
jgi:1-acyl-sn-glycerol-3-phosphate acyltransferase